MERNTDAAPTSVRVLGWDCGHLKSAVTLFVPPMKQRGYFITIGNHVDHPLAITVTVSDEEPKAESVNTARLVIAVGDATNTVTGSVIVTGCPLGGEPSHVMRCAPALYDALPAVALSDPGALTLVGKSSVSVKACPLPMIESV